MKGEARRLKQEARLSPERRLASALWYHIVPMTSGYHEATVAKLLRALDPKGNYVRKTMEGWRNSPTTAVSPPGQWIKETHREIPRAAAIPVAPMRRGPTLPSRRRQ